MFFVGIDVGGTHIKFGLIKDNEIVRKMSLATNTFDVIKQIVNGVGELVSSEGLTQDDIFGISVGFPGIVVDSVVLDSPNMGIQNCNLKEILEKEFDGKPVVVKNDAEMAALAEHRFGAGRNAQNMILITLGTGVGGGIIIDGKLYTGVGGAGELGHIVIDRNGRKCSCGRTGCAEQHVSLTALDRIAKETMVNYPNTCVTESGEGSVYASELVRAYKKNDACAIEILDKYVNELSSYVLSICNLFRPEKIVIGGGVAYAPEIIEKVSKKCKEENYGYKNAPKVDIVVAELGNDAGILGASVCLESVDITGGEFENYTSLEDMLEASEESVDEEVVEAEKMGDNSILDAIAEESKNENSLEIETDLEMTEGSEDIVYDENLLNRVNNLLKKKD